MDSLLQATLPPGPVEDEVDTCEALVLAGRVSELSNKATPEHSNVVLRGRLKRSARAVQLFGRLAVLETHTLRY